MAPLPAHWRLTFFGDIGGSSPWNTTLAMARPDDEGPSNYNAQAYATQLAADFRTLWQNGLGALNNTNTFYRGCTARWYASGSTAATLQGTAIATGSNAGVASSSGPAAQSCVLSIHTAVPGRSGRGRMYLPATGPLGAGVDSYKFPPALLTGLNGAAQAWFLNLRSASPNSSLIFEPSVASEALGAVNPYTRVSIDGRPDSQENRERQLSYQIVGFSHP